MMPGQSGVSLIRHLKVLFVGLLKCNKQSFLVPLLLVDFLVENAHRSLDTARQVSTKTLHLQNKKNSGSCRCLQREPRVGHSFCNDVT